MKNFLIVILGPTGVGKTDISIDLAKQFKCEIISADSRQFYNEMSVGTAVPSKFQLNIINHHFIHFKSVKDYYSASLFENDVLALLPSLFERNNLAIMAGGSAMYIDAVCYGIDDIPDVDPDARQKYVSLYQSDGIEGLRVALKMVDPVYYSKVDLRNPKRIMRALEIYDTSGRPYSSFLKKEKNQRPFTIVKIGLERERDDLYRRINSRVDSMFDSGLEDEVRGLILYRSFNALNTVGYKELFDYFDGTITREKAIELIKRNSRRFAKRQMTWWSKDKGIRWFNAGDVSEITNYIKTRL